MPKKKTRPQRLRTRLGARVLDLVLWWLGNAIFDLPAVIPDWSRATRLLVLGVGVVACHLVICAIPLAIIGTTWGKSTAEMHVATTSGARPSLPRALLRESLVVAGIPLVLYGAIVAGLAPELTPNPAPWIVLGLAPIPLAAADLLCGHRNPKRRCLHDMIAGTTVYGPAKTSPASPP